MNNYRQKFNSHPTKYVSIFKDKDREFETAWTDYHKRNCNLQILCAKCNLRKGWSVCRRTHAQTITASAVGKSIRRQRFKHHSYNCYSSDSYALLNTDWLTYGSACDQNTCCWQIINSFLRLVQRNNGCRLWQIEKRTVLAVSQIYCLNNKRFKG